MAVIYVKEQGAMVIKRGSRLLVEKDDQLLLEIPLRDTDSVAVFGNIQVTTQALSELLDRSIPLAFYTRHGRFKGSLTPQASKNVPLRLAQYRTSQDEGRSLEIAKAVVRAKLHNSAALIAAYRANYPSPDLERAFDSLRAAGGEAASAPARDQLLGYEGAAAAVYFRAFALMNRSDLPFETREKHPPPDPINALLSLGYTMATNEIRGLAEGIGLEPHIGFFHQIDYGRPSLALDLVEPFRSALVDRLTLRLVNERVFSAGDFAQRLTGPRAGGVVLQPDAFKRYLEQYESAVSESRKTAPRGVREAWREDVEKLARALRGGVPFEPFREVD